MQQKKVTYETQVVQENTIVRCNNYASISFRNVGEVDALVMKNISLPAQSIFSEYAFINSEEFVIGSDFPIEFTGTGKKRVEIIRAVYR